jgi:hypothetical protein
MPPEAFFSVDELVDQSNVVLRYPALFSTHSRWISLRIPVSYQKIAHGVESLCKILRYKGVRKDVYTFGQEN